MYTAYQLIWPGALFFALIIVVYATFQGMLNNLQNKSSDYLGISGVLVFFISAVLVFPFIHPEMGFSIYYYSWLHFVTILGALVILFALIFVVKLFRNKGLYSYYYPVAIIGIGIIGLTALNIVSPSLYSMITKALSTFFGI
jgi:dolichyl-phosphooligosaccharide-protein glycotransferase